MAPTSFHDAITMVGYHLSQLFVWALSFSHDVANVTISVSMVVVVVILTTGVVPGVLPDHVKKARARSDEARELCQELKTCHSR